MPRGSRSQPDKYAQLLFACLTEAVANTYIQLIIPLPVPRFGVSGNPYVFEIMRVWVTPIFALNQAALTTVNVQLSTITQPAISFDDPRVFVRDISQTGFTTSGATTFQPCHEHDFTIGDRGLLIGTDNLYLGLDTGATTAVSSVHVEIYYRLTRVNANEFIGIVQSQT